MSTWVKTPISLLESPDFADLVDADGGNLMRWLRLVFLATEYGDEGCLVHRKDRPWTARHLARRHGDTVEAMQGFLDLCVELNLLHMDDEGLLWIVDWAEWYGKPSDSREAVRERVARHREKRKAAAQDGNALQALHPVTAVTEPELPVTDVTPRNDKIRSDQIRSEKNRSDQIRSEDGVTVPERLCLAEFSLDAFLDLADQAHHKLAGSQLTTKNKSSLLDETGKGDWASHAWGDRAGALLIATEMTLAQQREGKVQKNPWFYAVKSAPSFLARAADINATNRLAPGYGEQMVPMAWDGSG